MKTLLTILTIAISLHMYGQEQVHIKMRSFRSKPIIQAELNGKKGYFLVDTGSDISIINTGEIKRYKLEERKIYTEGRRVIGFNGATAHVMRVLNANMILGNELDYNKFYSINIEGVARSIEAKTNIRIIGIVGADILLKYNCIIDYNQRELILVDGRVKKKMTARL